MPKTDIQALKEAIDIRELAERLGMETLLDFGHSYKVWFPQRLLIFVP